MTTPDQTELAWLEWDNPCMPWDQSRLVIAGLSGSGATIGTRNRRVLVDSIDRAVCQPGFLDDHSLLFVSDGNKNDFWDFYHFKDNKIQQVTSDCYEYGEAHWVFGQRRWQGISPTEIIAVASSHDGDSLVQLAVNTGKITPLYGGFAECANLHASEADSKLLLVSRYPDRDAEIRSINPESGISQAVYIASSSHKVHGNSQPEPIAYPTRDGQQAYAYFYAPFNKKYCGPENSKPPLLVVVHGGPTSRATSALHPLKQYFTSLGYAVLDINHRGSTGYGRTYRQSLLGQWGEVDATDIVDGIKYVMDKGLADPDLVFIRGGSAGGYAVLRSLTRFPQMFSGGACYYGIGNLITLAEITHKFEGCYTDRLIGEKFNPDTAHNPDSRFTRRSPIFQMDRLVSPLILFQGLDDKVVPPAVSREVAELLGKKGIQYEYVEYENEGHGFRQLPTRVDSLKRETAFFSTIIQAKALSRQKRAGKSQQ